jgi:hypothetical protein
MDKTHPTLVFRRFAQDTPPRMFCEKSLDLLDSTGLNFFGNDKESLRV